MSVGNPLQTPELHPLIPRFEWNARNVYEDTSALYYRLSRELIGDGKLLVLASHIPATQPAPNLFFSAVHYLLMREPNRHHRLRAFFHDLTPRPNTRDDPYPIFREFCLTHVQELRDLLETRSVQLNEIGRCAFFMPVFNFISARVGGEPFAVIEVGSSAGLNLLWDRYAYDYGLRTLYGDTSSSIVLRCALRGSKRPPLEQPPPPVAFRFGIDLAPQDVRDEDAMLWLRALVWPEHVDRARHMEKAIALARQHPPLVLQGDALDLVPRALDAISPDLPVLLFHSFVLNQFPAQARERYYAMLTERSAGRRLFDMAIEPREWPAPLVLTTYKDRGYFEQTLASCDVLGRWIEWYE